MDAARARGASAHREPFAASPKSCMWPANTQVCRFEPPNSDLDRCRKPGRKSWPGWPYPHDPGADFITHGRPCASSACAGGGVRRPKRQERRHMTWQAYPSWLTPGDNAWQMTAATLVGLMSVPGLAVLYGGVMQKRWSVNSMMLTFVAFCLTLIAWCLWAFKMGFGHPIAKSGSGILGTKGFIGTMWGEGGSFLGQAGEEGE